MGLRVGGALPKRSPGGKREEEADASFEVVFRDKSKLAAVCAHRMIIAEGHVHLVRYADAVFQDLFFSGRSRVGEGEVGIDGSGEGLFFLLFFEETGKDWIPFLDDGGAEEVEIFIFKVGVAGGDCALVFRSGEIVVEELDA